MKNIKHLLLATAALISVSSMATVVQPLMPLAEDTMRISTGLFGGMVAPKNEKDETKFGFNNVGLGVGFAHNVGYDFTYGIALGLGWAAPEMGAGSMRIFTEETKKMSGLRMDIDLMASFMPEIADKLHVGGRLNIGYGRLFGIGEGNMLKEMSKEVAFGDLALAVGPAISYGFTDMVSVYFAPAYTLTGIRFISKDTSEASKKVWQANSNLSGIEAPLGLWVAVSDNVGLFVDVNTKFRNFSEFTKTWKEEVTLGASFAI